MKRKHWEEAIVDTTVATLINIPINYVLLEFVFEMGWGTAVATIFLTSIFMFISVFRKVYISKYYERKRKKKSKTNDSKN